MSDGGGFLVAAYALTALTLLIYAVRLGLRRGRAERRLAQLRRDVEAPVSRDEHVARHLESELVGGGHV